jgi:hypothetical protein
VGSVGAVGEVETGEGPSEPPPQPLRAPARTAAHTQSMRRQILFMARGVYSLDGQQKRYQNPGCRPDSPDSPHKRRIECCSPVRVTLTYVLMYFRSACPAFLDVMQEPANFEHPRASVVPQIVEVPIRPSASRERRLGWLLATDSVTMGSSRRRC